MLVEGKKKSSKPLYEKNSFLVIEDKTVKDDFTIGLIEKDVHRPNEKIDIILLRRDEEHGISHFKTDKETEIDFNRVLFVTDKVQMFLDKKLEDGLDASLMSQPPSMALDSLRIFFTKNAYREISSQVAKILEERHGSESEDAGDLSIEHTQFLEREDLIPIEKEDRVKLLGRKKVSIGKRGLDDSMLGSEVLERKVKTSSAKKAPSSRKAPKPPVYKKGKINPNVELVEFSEQYEGNSPIPDFTCCKKCNNKELLRAVLSNNETLLRSILNSKDTLTTFWTACGPDSSISVARTLIKQRDFTTLTHLLKEERVPGKFSEEGNHFKFSLVDTGVNDKYAYGVQTRRVEMSRGNREGTNAFLYDDREAIFLKYSEPDIEVLCRYLNDEEAFLTIATYETELLTNLESKVCQTVLLGNRFLASKLAEKMYLNNGWGFSKFHFLAVSAESEADLFELKKVNTKKKSYGNNQITPTHMACINPNPNVLKTFLDLGEEMYITDELLRKPIHYAACCSSSEPLQLLLDRGIDCRDFDRAKMTPVMYAAIAGRSENIKVMCNHTPYNVNMKSREGYAALHYAVMHNNHEAVYQLLEVGANINLIGKNRMMPLMIAAQKGYFDLVVYLLEKGAKILARDKYRKSALLYAVINGHVKIASYLLQKGAEYNGTDSSGNSAMHFACAYGHWELIDLLVKTGVDINAPNSWNLTPILVALMKNHYRCVIKMTEYPNIDVNCQDNNGCTLLMNNLSKFTPETFKIVEFLIKYKNASVSIGDFSGNNALHMLAMKVISKKTTYATYKEAVEAYETDKQLFKGFFDLLITSNIDVNQRNMKSYSALDIAIDCGNWLFVELILDNPNIKWDECNEKNQTIVHNCASLLFHKQGRQILERMISKVWNSHKFHNTFDYYGYNFYHALLRKFVKKLKINEFVNLYSNKISFYQHYLQTEDAVTDADRQVLLKKIQSAESKKLSRYDQTIQSFEQFNEYLRTLDYDFGIEVLVIREPYEKFLERRKKNSKGDVSFKQQIYGRNFNYTPSTYDIVQDQNSTAEKKPDFIINNNAGASVLQLAMIYPVARIVNQLIAMLREKNRFQPNYRNHFGATVFHYLAGANFGNGEVVKILLQAGEDPNIPNFNKSYPFLIVCQKENREVFLELLRHNVQVNIYDDYRVSPLIFFAKKRKTWEIEQLLNHGADINILDAENRNALHWAINNNKCEDAEFALEDLLIDRDININAIDIRGRTPLHYFFAKIGNPLNSSTKDPIELVSDFLGNGHLMIDVADNYGNTPLIYAAQRGAYLSIGMLHKRGANLNHFNNDNNSALSVALLYGKIDVAVYFLQQNVNFSHPCFDIDFKARLKHQIEEEKKQRERGAIQAEEGVIEVRKSELENFLNPPVSQSPSTEENEEENGNQTDNFNNGFPSFGMNQMGFGAPKRIPSKSSFNARKKTRRAQFNGNQNDEENNNNNEDLIKLKARGFIRRKLSVFELALRKKADSVMYLLIASGFSIGQAVMESINQNLFNYSSKLLKKRVFTDQDHIRQVFDIRTEHKRNLFHAFALKSDALPNEMLETMFDLLMKREIEPNLPDIYDLSPILYVALKSKNIKLIDTFIGVKVSPFSHDNRGNNLLTCFIQNNTTLQSSFKQDQKGLNLICSKSPIECKIINPFNLQFGVAVLENIGATLREARIKRESMNKQQLLNNQASFQDEIVQLSWIKMAIREYGFDINQPFKLLKASEPDITGAEIYTETPKIFTLLFYAAKKLQNLRLLEILLESGADINSSDDKGSTLLTHAIRSNNILLIMFLLQYQNKINFNHIDSQGKSYIHHVVSPMQNASFQNLALLEFLASKTSLDRVDRDGFAPLYYAKQQDNGQMAQRLVMLGAREMNYQIIKMPTSVVANFEFEPIQFDFEEDHLRYVELMKSRFENTGLSVEVKPTPDSRLKGELEIVNDPRTLAPFDYRFIKVDISYGQYSTNVFYIMQIAYDKIRKIYVLFTSWGRVGTEGQFQQTPFFHLEDAMKEFKKLFKEKTGNDYDNIENYHKKPQKYHWIQTKPKPIHSNLVKFFDLHPARSAPSKLPKSIGSVMEDLTDANLYKTVYSAFKIDESFLPFGQLNRETIEKAQLLLDEMKVLAKRLDDGRGKLSLNICYEIATQISEKTSEYYELIPSVGSKTEQIPAFNTYRINNENIRLNDLRYMEVVSRILAAANMRVKEINPLDYCFAALGIKMVPLEADSEEFYILKMYIKTGVTCSAKKLIKNVYAIERRGEKERFKSWLEVGNRRLLWHGTRTENLMGIFYNGLRIAPSEGGYNGSNLGKGIYFSDAFQRSIPFSSHFNCDFKNKPSYIMLCEVALGKMFKGDTKEIAKEMPADCQSVKGQGRKVHNKNQRVYLSNGCMVPIGDFVDSKKASRDQRKMWNYFEYNEFAVYDPSQVKIRYLLELDSQLIDKLA